MKGRFDWWPNWIEKKRKYAKIDEKQFDPDKFNAICVGTGLPSIHQTSTLNFKNDKIQYPSKTNSLLVNLKVGVLKEKSLLHAILGNWYEDENTTLKSPR